MTALLGAFDAAHGTSPVIQPAPVGEPGMFAAFEAYLARAVVDAGGAPPPIRIPLDAQAPQPKAPPAKPIVIDVSPAALVAIKEDLDGSRVAELEATVDELRAELAAARADAAQAHAKLALRALGDAPMVADATAAEKSALYALLRDIAETKGFAAMMEASQGVTMRLAKANVGRAAAAGWIV